MLQLTLARRNLLCGYGNALDPSRDPSQSGHRGSGCRPSIFFGPHRDALHLITRRLHSALILKNRYAKDLEQRVIVLPLPGGHPETADAWLRQIRETDLHNFVAIKELEQSSSRLESDADVYHQEFQPEGGAPYLGSIRIEALIEDNCLRESWQLTASDPYDAWYISWHEPEIGASQLFQSTIYHSESRTLCSFRSSVFFGMQAYRDGKSLPVAFADCGSEQGQKARTRFGEILRSLWKREEFLGSAAARLGKDNGRLPLEMRSDASIGATDGLIVWKVPSDGRFELRHRLAPSIDSFSSPLPNLQQAAARVRSDDHAWLGKLRPAPPNIRHDVKNHYQRSLLVLKQMQDPSGGLIAAPEFHYDLTHCGGYGFCWGRDAAFIAYAMDVCGMHEESQRFYRYVQACQSADGSFLQRHDMLGGLAPSWSLLQPDECGSILFGLGQHLRLSGDISLTEDLRLMIQRGADWLANAVHEFDRDLPIAGHDLWEEREGVHLYSIATMVAGLEAAQEIYRSSGWDVPKHWQDKAEELRSLCLSPRFIFRNGKDPILARSLLRRVSFSDAVAIPDLRLEDGKAYLPEDTIVDASFAGLIYPFGILQEKDDSELIQALIQKIFDRLWRKGQGGIGRYEGDRYRDGNPWILTTLWLALAGRSCPELSRQAWTWTLDHISPEGLFPEQIDPRNGGPAWVMPLAWSHAMFVLAIHQLPHDIIG